MTVGMRGGARAVQGGARAGGVGAVGGVGGILAPKSRQGWVSIFLDPADLFSRDLHQLAELSCLLALAHPVHVHSDGGVGSAAMNQRLWSYSPGKKYPGGVKTQLDFLISPLPYTPREVF